MLFDRFSIMGFVYNGELNCKVGDLRDFWSAGYWLIITVVQFSFVI